MYKVGRRVEVWGKGKLEKLTLWMMDENRDDTENKGNRKDGS